MVTYLKNSVPGFFFPIDEPLDPGSYDIGASLDEFNQGKYIPLTEEQVRFHEQNPGASIREVWRCKLDPGPTAEETAAQRLEDARRSKLADIHRHDTSEAVNSFSLGGKSMWLDKADRVGLANSISIEADAGRTLTVLWFGGVRYGIPIPAAKAMLAALELYALECYNVTASHCAAVNALETVEDIEAYDHTAGYPEKLVFNIGEGGGDA